MSKLNVNELEANGTNSNLKVVSKGTTGVAEVTGADNDATLQLNCSAQSHGVKLKAPADSAGQNYTLALPDNQIAANKLIKVKNITGSGTTAEGQLEFVDTPPTAYTSLDAANVTSGVFPTARIGGISATSGGGLKLINKTVVPSGTDTNVISFTGLEDNGHYLIIGKDVKYTSTMQYLNTIFLDADGTKLKDAGTAGGANNESYICWNNRRTTQNYFNGVNGTTNPMQFQSDNVSANMYMRMELFTGTDRVYFSLYGHILDYSYPYYFLGNANIYQPTAGTRVHGIQFSGGGTGSYNFTNPTTFLLYQYMDA